MHTYVYKKSIAELSSFNLTAVWLKDMLKKRKAKSYSFYNLASFMRNWIIPLSATCKEKYSGYETRPVRGQMPEALKMKRLGIIS